MLRNFLIWLCKKSVLARIIMRGIKKNIETREYVKAMNSQDVDETLWVFEAFNGRRYCDSPKALYLELLSKDKYKKYNFIWCFRNPKDYPFLENNPRTKVIGYKNKEYKEAYARAKYWVTCSRLLDFLIPKEDQICIQCWHGTPLKRIGADIEVNGNVLHNSREIEKEYREDGKRYTFMVSPSKYVSQKYISAFCLDQLNKTDCIIEEGYPRNDALFKFSSDEVMKLRRAFNIPEGKKAILYAPTWRDNQHKTGIGYVYDLRIDFDEFMNRFSGEYVVLFRTHYLIANSIDLSKYRNFIIDVSGYSDINDLYIVSDLLITDYSSVFFDYANLHRPMLFYMYDLEEYKNILRDFYLEFDELPGPIVTQEERLYNEIKSIEGYWKRYGDIYKRFTNKFNYLDDDSSSKRVIKEIINRSERQLRKEGKI